MKKLLCVAATAAVLMAPMMASALPFLGTCYAPAVCKNPKMQAQANCQYNTSKKMYYIKHTTRSACAEYKGEFKKF